jgi:hypothetical protein
MEPTLKKRLHTVNFDRSIPGKAQAEDILFVSLNSVSILGKAQRIEWND